jgi:4-amino-4-deoxy-L-arabinose transferase-like glycosyltransferase
MSHLQKLKPLLFPVEEQSVTVQDWVLVTVLIIVAFLIRFPFFFPAVIDWDESTFILMGQSILDGHLPYTTLWDIKPPLAFFAYASFILVFGKTIAAVRLAGWLCTSLIAIMVYGIGKTFASRTSCFFGAILSLFGISFVAGGSATLTEHIALVPLMAAFSILAIRPNFNYWHIFLVGLLMNTASLVRLNLAYPTLFLGIYLTLRYFPNWKKMISSSCAYTGGSFLVFFISYFPYLVTGYSQIWWQSVIVAPLNYASDQYSILSSLGKLVNGIVESSDIRFTFPVILCLWLGGFWGFIQAFRIVKTDRLKKPTLKLLLILGLGTGFSVLASGGAFKHYLIQIVPFFGLGFILFSSLFLENRMKTISSQRLQVSVLTVSSLLVLLSLQPILTEYGVIAERYVAGQPLRHGSPYAIADYLKSQNVENQPVYLLNQHLVYWLIDAQPLTKATTHPSNISKQYLLDAINEGVSSPEQEMQNIFAQVPEFIVKHQEVDYLSRPESAAARQILETQLSRNYHKIQDMSGILIYRRIDS